MNERIKELAEQAGFIPDNAPDMNPVLEKFAELIVYECLSIMKNCDGDLDFAIWNTKKRFGVEE